MKAPKSISSHPAVKSVVAGEDEGSDCKYWVFLKDGWGYYEGARESYNWICGGFGVYNVAEFKSLNLEKKA